MSLPQNLAITDEVALASWGNLVLVLYRAPVSLEVVQAIGESCQAAAQKYPQGIAMITVMPENTPLPDDKVRGEISAMMSKIEPYLRVVCGVQEAPGVRGAAVRSMTRAMELMIRAPFKMKTVDNTKAAAEILAPFIEPAATTVQVEVAISQFRKQIGEALLNRQRAKG